MSLRSACVVAVAFIASCSEGTDALFNEIAQVSIFSAAGYSVVVGQTLQLEGRAVNWAGNRVDERITAWATSDASIATVSNKGLVQGIGVGTAFITATAEGVTSQERLVTVTGGSGPPQ